MGTVEIATLDLYTGEIDFFNTNVMTMDQFCEFFYTITNIRENSYKLTHEEIERAAAGGMLRFSMLIK